MITAYDDPILWDGHASMVEEIAQQLPADTKPDAVVCCWGGGGLAAGVMEGLKRVGWDDGKCVFDFVGSMLMSCLGQSLSWRWRHTARVASINLLHSTRDPSA